MTKKTKGRAGGHQHTASNTFFISPYFTSLSNRLKPLIVTLAVWGLIPIGWTDWINHQEDQDNE